MAVMLLEWIFTSAFLILVVLALRAALGKRMSAGLRYVLWAVVLVRLLVPVQLFTSPIAGTWVVTEKRTEHNVYTPTSQPAAPEGPDNALSLGGQDGPAADPGNFPQAPALPAAPNPPEPPDLNSLPGWTGYLGWVWLGGSAAAALVLLASNLQFFRKLRRVRVPLDGADCPLPVYIAAGLPSPCLFGLLRPAVYVTPETAADPAMLRHILAHELTHFRHLDHIWNILRCAALAAHWWNPLVWLAVVLSRRDGEMACDEGALKRLGDGERLAYGNTLLALVTAQPRPVDLFRCATTMAGDKKSLKERISRIACAPRRILWAAVAAVLVTALACVCAFGQAAEPEADQDPADKVEIAFPHAGNDMTSSFDVPEYVLQATKSWVARQFTIDAPGGEMVPFVGEAEYSQETGRWEFKKYPDDVRAKFDRVRINYMSGPWVSQTPDADLEVWRINYEYHTTTPETAELVLAGGRYLTEDGWLCPTYCNCTYVVFDGNGAFLDAVMFNTSDPDSNSEIFWQSVRKELGYIAPDSQRNETLYSRTLVAWADAQVLDVSPDLNRDGVREAIKVMDIVYVDGEQPSGRRVSVWQGDELLWMDEGDYAHGGWNAVFLCTLDGEDYLLRYHPTMYQGYATYRYQLFTLENDQETVIRENGVDFDLNFHPLMHQSFDPDAIADFMDEVNGLLANSVQLINTDGNLLPTFEKEGRLYDSLWFLDSFEETFVRDPSKSLLENLRAFQAAMEGQTAQGSNPYLAVIQGNEPLYIPEYAARMTLDEFCAKVGPGYAIAGISDFSVLDLDGDGAQEVVLNLDRTYRQWCVVLHEQGGKVRGYALYIRWLNTYSLKEDGAFDWTSSAFENGWGKLRFTEDGYETIYTIWSTIWADGGTYYIGDQAVPQAEYDAANHRQEAVPDAVWYDFTPENIETALR